MHLIWFDLTTFLQTELNYWTSKTFCGARDDVIRSEWPHVMSSGSAVRQFNSTPRNIWPQICGLRTLLFPWWIYVDQKHFSDYLLILKTEHINTVHSPLTPFPFHDCLASETPSIIPLSSSMGTAFIWGNASNAEIKLHLNEHWHNAHSTHKISKCEKGGGVSPLFFFFFPLLALLLQLTKLIQRCSPSGSSLYQSVAPHPSQVWSHGWICF